MISAGTGLVSIVVADAFLSALGRQDCLRPSRVHNRVGISDVSIGSFFEVGSRPAVQWCNDIYFRRTFEMSIFSNLP